MPFSSDTKAKMFIKSARICCLCYKPCGTNIEAAHIVDEHRGGGNDESNGIPVCFDCHQEIGGYDPKHPKGNKFTEVELKARRDMVYSLVETGFLQAQIIMQRLNGAGALSKELPPEQPTKAKYKPTSEAMSMLDDILKGKSSVSSIPYKMGLLNEEEQAYVLESLVSKYDKRDVLPVLLAIVEHKNFSERGFLIIEHLIRKVTLSSDLGLKNNFAGNVPIEAFKNVNEGSRTAFFVELIDIMEHDQWDDVNVIAYSTVRVQDAVPQELQERYLLALLHMADSGAWSGKPAAKDGLNRLAPEQKTIVLGMITPEFIQWKSQKDFYKGYVTENRKYWPSENESVLEDFITMKNNDFTWKYQER